MDQRFDPGVHGSFGIFTNIQAIGRLTNLRGEENEMIKIRKTGIQSLKERR